MEAPRRPLVLLALLLAACSGGPGADPDDRSGDTALSLDLYETEVRPSSHEAVSRRVVDGVETEEGTIRKIVTYSPTYDVDRIDPSMRGPSSAIVVKLREGWEQPELLWIKGVRAQVVDEQGEPHDSQEFMCHVVGGIRTVDEHDSKMGVVSLDNRFATLSQGQYHKEYPRGFGVPVLSTDVLQFSSQVLNLNFPQMNQRMRHRIVTLYLRDRDARVPMKAITNTFAQSMVRVGGEPGDGYFGIRMPDVEIHGESCAAGRNASPTSNLVVDAYGHEFSAHWVVEPGRATNQTLATRNMRIPYDTRIHAIDVHVHPFAESLELRDLTTQETVYQSRARQVSEGIGLARVETYSSEEGIPVYADHEYAIISTYDNTSGVQQDAMASLFLAFHNKEFDREAIGNPAALALKRRQRIQASLKSHRQAVLDDPADPIAHHRLGLGLFHLDRLDEAIEHFEEAARLDPDNPNLSKSLGQARSRLEIALIPFE